MTRQRQSGIISLSQLQIVLGISMLISTANLWHQAQKLRGEQAAAQADALVVLTNSVTTYATNNYAELVKTTPAISGIATPYSPTIANLQAQGVLASTFTDANLYNPSLHPGYQIQISKFPAACVAPNCDLKILVNLKTPITNPMNGRIDGGLLGAALQRAGGNAGYSDLTSPGTIAGFGGGWSEPNPETAGGQPVAGILAMRAGYGASGMDQFVRRDGSKPMTNHWNTGGYNVTGINTLGSVTLNNSSNANVGGTLGVTGQTTTNGITNNGTLTNSGNATVGGTLGVTGQTTTNGITNNGNIVNSGDVQTGRLWLKTIVSNGQPCPGLNGYQAATAAGSIASCINSQWTTPNATTAPPPPCNTQSVSWGSGCSGTVYGTTSGSSSSASASTGTGSATFVCNAGSWLFQSGTCTPPPSPCSGTYSWGGGKCSKSYSISSGGQQTLSYSAAGPVQAGGSYSGSATLSCNNGSVSPVGTPTCSYTVSSPMVINSSVASQQSQPTGVRLAANATSQGSWCSAVLPGSTVTSAPSTNIGASGQWTCWGNSGYTCAIPWDGSNCSGTNGCSCWNYANANSNQCWVTSSLTCTRYGS